MGLCGAAIDRRPLWGPRVEGCVARLSRGDPSGVQGDWVVPLSIGDNLRALRVEGLCGVAIDRRHLRGPRGRGVVWRGYRWETPLGSRGIGLWARSVRDPSRVRGGCMSLKCILAPGSAGQCRVLFGDAASKALRVDPTFRGEPRSVVWKQGFGRGECEAGAFPISDLHSGLVFEPAVLVVFRGLH